jgi:hypothetical protein
MKKTILLLAELLALRAYLWAALVVLSALAFGPPPVQAAVTEAWVHRYTNGVASAVAVDASGNVVVTGHSYNTTNSDYYTAKYAGPDGALLWERRYSGPANSLDQPSAVAVDGSGNVIVTGVSDAKPGVWGLLLGGDDYTIKYAAVDGALLWQKRQKASSGGYHLGPTLAVDGSGNVVVTGYSETDNYVAKYGAADGALLWEKHYSSPVNSEGGAIPMAVDGSGNVVVTGSSYNGTNADYYTAKYAAGDGALLWEKRHNSPANGDDEATAVAVDGSGNAVVTGSSRNSSGNLDYYTAKYAAANGTLLWEKRYEGPANSVDVPLTVVVNGSGDVVVTGNSEGYYTAKYAAANGALLWEKRSNSGGRTAAVDGSDNVVVIGHSATVKYAAADGALLWERSYNGGASSLALGPNGMVAVTGTSDGDFATVVYRENLPPVSIEMVSTRIRLRFTGIPGRSYTIERAPAVTGPWNTINTQTAPASGFLEYIDTTPPTGSAFYRTAQP